MNIKNFNQPRPRWAAATSKLLRVVTVAIAAAFYGADSSMGVFLSFCGGAVADFILDLFPNEAEQAAKAEEENNKP